MFLEQVKDLGDVCTSCGLTKNIKSLQYKQSVVQNKKENNVPLIK